MNLYLTQDLIGLPTGGGAVTYHEYRALAGFGSERGVVTHPLDAGMVARGATPFESDKNWLKLIGSQPLGLVHAYAGCFTETIKACLKAGAKVTYTAAAHDINESRREFNDLGIPFSFPHLTVPEGFERYVGGYKLAHTVICPSELSKRVMESYGCKNVIVIPHGCHLPEVVPPLPKRFCLGYMGQAGPDKGLRYLFEAWKKVNLKDSTLVVAGGHINEAFDLWKRFGGGNVEFIGFVPKLEDFYAKISAYCQPSVSEGFGMEVLEAMAHGRRVIVSDGAGAADLVRRRSGIGTCFQKRDVDDLVGHILALRLLYPSIPDPEVAVGREEAKLLSWSNVRAMYQHHWRSLTESSGAW